MKLKNIKPNHSFLPFNISLVLLLPFILCVNAVLAQNPQPEGKRTTDKPSTVNVYSTFTPTLGNTQMLNFGNKNASLPTLPKANVDYQVVDQNLFFPQSSGSLHPVTLNTSDGNSWKKTNFIKLGYGNYKTSYGEGSFSMGDGENSSFSLRAMHTSSVGNLPQQKFAKTNADLDGVINIGNNQELSGRLFFDNNNVNAYGIRPADYSLVKNFINGNAPNGLYDFDSSKLKYYNFGLKVQLRNKHQTVPDIDYSPSLFFERFSDNWSASEYNGILDVPLTKKIKDNIFLNLGLTADITKYQSRDTSINNNIFYFKPSLVYKTADTYIKLGAIPLINKGEGKLLPDIQAEKQLGGENFIVSVGYTGYYDKNTFKNLAAFNPWIYQPRELNNTRVIELYGGIRGSLGNHITYSATYSQLTYYDIPLFLNDTLLGNRFNITYEPKLKDRRISGGLGYEISELFSIVGNITYHNYYQLDSNAQAWGLLPLEVNGMLRWKIVKALTLKSDVNYWTGAWAMDANKNPIQMKSVVNLNAGLELSLSKAFNFWIQVNNVLNNKYQRWSQYENLGLNVYGGLIINF